MTGAPPKVLWNFSELSVREVYADPALILAT